MLKDKELLNNEKLDEVNGGGAEIVIVDNQVFTNKQIKTLMEKNKDNSKCYLILLQMFTQGYIEKDDYNLIAKPLGSCDAATAYKAYQQLLKNGKFDIRAYSYLYHKRFPEDVIV